MRDSFLTFGSPCLDEAAEHEVLDSMRQRWIGTGPKVRQFENLFASYKGISSVAAVSSCSAALHLSCMALNLQPGDEVITSPMTFCATINAIIHSGATPVLADIDPQTLNINPERIREKITEKTRAVVVVHFAGRPCEMDEILEIASNHNLAVIEDCAHALEAEYFGRKVGTIGNFGCFSFYATKNITTGEGGMVVSREHELIDRIKVMAMNGLSADAWQRYSDKGHKHYYVTDVGFKYNMMDLQAAIGLHQITQVDKFWQRRQELWQFYMDELASQPVTLPSAVPESIRHAYHLFSVRINEQQTGICRDDFIQRLIEQNIGVGVHYFSIAEHPYYRQKFGWDPDDFPHARDYGNETVSLPLSPCLSDRDVRDVVDAVAAVLSA